MRSKRLTVKKSRRLVWTSWFELLVAGVVVYIFTNPLNFFGLLFVGPIVLHALINIWVKSEYIPVTLDSVVPTVFLPTAFLAGIGALVAALVSSNGFLNPWTFALATVCVTCIMVVYPESRYADYE